VRIPFHKGDDGVGKEEVKSATKGRRKSTARKIGKKSTGDDRSKEQG